MDFYQRGYQERKQDGHDKLFLRLKLGVIFGVPLVTVLLTIFIFRFYHIEGTSMEPSLKNNERVIIEKIDKTWAKLRGQDYVPERYDVVVLKEPGAREQIIKRVIGLPGERIVIANNNVIIINSKHPEGYLVDKQLPAQVVLDPATSGDVDRTLQAHEVFVLGDNRQHSVDSRSFGPIDTHSIIGRLWTSLKFF